MGIDCTADCGINILLLWCIAIAVGFVGYFLARWRRWTILLSALGAVSMSLLMFTGEHPNWTHWLPAVAAIVIASAGGRRPISAA